MTFHRACCPMLLLAPLLFTALSCGRGTEDGSRPVKQDSLRTLLPSGSTGDSVKAPGELVKAAAAVKQAEARLKVCRQALTRDSLLLSRGALARSDYYRSRREYDAAVTEARKARQHLTGLQPH